MSVDYIIVQAGGKGERMRPFTENKPKALVPVDNLPILFHLFRSFPDKKYVIIGDYKEDVLSRYLAAFAGVSYTLISGKGHAGNCAGLGKALSLIPDGCPFLLIWSDLILSPDQTLPDGSAPVIGISREFPCRYAYRGGTFRKELSSEQGVAGLFVFPCRQLLQDVWEGGEFVDYLAQKEITFDEMYLDGCREYGLSQNVPSDGNLRCRPFNRIDIEGGILRKQGIDEKGKALAEKERNWYQKVRPLGFSYIPAIYRYDPLEMELIDGVHPYEMSASSPDEKRELLVKITCALKELHSLDAIPSDRDAYYEAYLHKTFRRLQTVRALIPFADDPVIKINGRSCRNVFFHADDVEKALARYFPEKFTLIHGDCTFSNTLIDRDNRPVFIDPRGYFAGIDCYGDPAYDWAKLYYSLISNYDAFNQRRFALEIRDSEVFLTIPSNGFEELEQDYIDMLEGEATYGQLHLILAILWLSLSSYAWEDYDSICGAFYNGLYYLEESLSC